LHAGQTLAQIETLQREPKSLVRAFARAETRLQRPSQIEGQFVGGTPAQREMSPHAGKSRSAFERAQPRFEPVFAHGHRGRDPSDESIDASDELVFPSDDDLGGSPWP